MNKPTQKHNHAEAFKLMQYRCEKCGKFEVLWNSRDGVTPLIISCRQKNCKGGMQHVNWQSDIYMPNHIPASGQRVFIDMPDELKMPTARYMVQRGMGDGLELTDKPENIALRIAESFHEGDPWIITWP